MLYREATRIIVACFFVAILLIEGQAFAQESRYAIGTTIDLIGGRTNNLTSTLGSASEKPFLFYGAYPSVTFSARGARSLVNLTYAFGSNRTETDNKLTANTHSGTLTISNQLSQRWRISLSEGLQITDDSATFNGFRGVTTSPDDFRFVFNPVAVRLTTRTNNAGIVTDYTMTDKSSFSFSASHNMLEYGDQDSGTAANRSLSNQQRMTGSVTYNRRTSLRDTWSVGYTVAYFDFAEFQNSISDTGFVGYSTQLGRDFNFQLTVGTSRTENLVSRASQIGYNMSATLQKTLSASSTSTNSFALYYTQTSGDASGLGSISKTQSAGLSLRRDMRRLTVFADIGAFETTGTLDNTFNARGIQGAATIGLRLTRTFSIQGGAQYQEHDKTSPFAFSQQRAFISLRFNNPTLIRF